MQTFHRLLAAATIAAVSATAQNDLGTWLVSATNVINPTVNTASRGTTNDSNNNPVVVWDRLDKEVYAAWGADPAFPGTRTVNGIRFIIQDANLATQDPFGIVLYTENMANPNFPDIVTPVATSGLFILPVGAGGGAYFVTLTFATPAHAPATGDVFVGVNLQGGVLAADRLSIQGATTAVDKSGAGQVVGGQPLNFGGYYAPLGVTPLAYSAANRQYFIEPIIPGAAGVAQAITNQTTNVPSNTAPGTPSQYSGAYPDAASPSLNAGRVDDVAMTFRETGILDGTLVFFLLDLGNFSGIELPIPLPGSTGLVALNPATMFVSAIGATLAGVASNVWAIPAGARTIIAGLPVLNQAISFDGVTLAAHAGPGVRQLF